ncbi:MAG: glucuronate isomerase [Bacteroidota bacterium]|nr:glucuronate isomerase [Bacteroidota bacterium]
MKSFIHENFLLQSSQAVELYHRYAKDQPIIDYHCHLQPELIAEDHQFENLWEIWLKGDHYKWRAMRTNGIPEQYCTGDADPFDKFEKWAETLPYTLRNPLYHWSHLELARYFGVYESLTPDSAERIYNSCSEQLQTKEFSCRNLMHKMKVEVVCTTDDPIDDLSAHEKIAKDEFEIKVLPTFRADKACMVTSVESYNQYLDQLSEKSGIEIRNYDDLINALQNRHDFFHSRGCRLSDHGLNTFNSTNGQVDAVDSVFAKLRNGNHPSHDQLIQMQTTILWELAIMDHEKGWVQQFHYGALRNNNTDMLSRTGPDTGFDSIGDTSVASAMSGFFDHLQNRNQLAKTIIYNLNPSDNHMVATMIGNFQDGSVPGKIQFGSGWWFLDQKDGMEQQMNTLSNLGLLSRFVGMLTDSRSFLSYPRHEYFRRILCNLLGEDMKNGILPDDQELIGKMVSDISYWNARNYFGFYS